MSGDAVFCPALKIGATIGVERGENEPSAQPAFSAAASARLSVQTFSITVSFCKKHRFSGEHSQIREWKQAMSMDTGARMRYARENFVEDAIDEAQEVFEIWRLFIHHARGKFC